MNIKINIAADIANMKIYEKKKICNSAELRHECVLCGARISIDGSFSNRGHKMICGACAKTKFKTMREMWKWMEEFDEQI